ncbi:histone deacetylase [Vibrio nigripulchritudo]|uniref:histone deacetylase family protein n=1 Tax=Vibrio nigripulchritudo TaxID=28173 RepID=UPI0003B22992|nr:histone deacetylase [Vibrio nigripulchritudo]CCN71982.1 hypothetical protein VIBNISFn118_470086 [Vibrio nigripulchritudo SFn118]
MIHVFYSEGYNINLGLLNYIHPFDGMKFGKIFNAIEDNPNITFHQPYEPIDQEVIDGFMNELIRRLVKHKKTVMKALEVPSIPFVSFEYLDKKVLLPMRLGIQGTVQSARLALTGESCWNLAGGYHHASQHSMEGFCIYNDIGIAYQELLKSGELSTDDEVLIIDTDAHHGNGNARTFIDNSKITILDVFNESIYPHTESTRERVNFPVPVAPKVTGTEYLSKYKNALTELTSSYKLAFVVAGSDVLNSDKLGGLHLTLDDVVEREKITYNMLNKLNIPAVFLGGGGYSSQSAKAVSAAINTLSHM